MNVTIMIITIIFLPMIAAFVSYGIGRKHKDGRNLFADLITGVTFVLCATLAIQVMTGGAADGSVSIPYICGMGIEFTLDGFRALYGTVAAFMWFMTTLFSREYFGHYRNRNRYYLFLLLTLGATEGVFFSADFFTTFLFFVVYLLCLGGARRKTGVPAGGRNLSGRSRSRRHGHADGYFSAQKHNRQHPLCGP